MGFPCGSAGKESACNAGDLDSIPRLGRFPGEGKGYPFHYFGLENSMDCTIHGVAKSQTRLSDFYFHFLSLRALLISVIQFSPHPYEASTSVPSVLQTSCSSAGWWQRWSRDSDPGRGAPDGSGCYTVNGGPHISETDSGESKQDNTEASGTANCRL